MSVTAERNAAETGAVVFSAERIAEIVAPPGEAPRAPTPEQARIIEQPLGGSVLVIAGAGSGKTETMANRVVWLIANGLARPAEVLGLTFTRKAAGELNDRIAARLVGFADHLDELRSRGGLGPAESTRATELRELLADGLELPEVSTYNAFASGVVQEFGAAAGVAVAATVIDEPTAWRIARETVCRSDDPELAGSDYSIGALVKQVLTLDHAISDNLTTCDAVDVAVAEFETAGEWSYADNRLKKPYAEVMKAVSAVGATRLAVRLVRAFSAEKRRRGLIEFSDQLALAVETLARSREAVRTLRHRSRVVLLDEVQDTSVGQTRLLSTLFAGNSVMAVGDPHQSIYGFRGASASNLTSFHRDFSSGITEDDSGSRAAPPATAPGGRTLNLSVSWRNPTEVLRVANRISTPLAMKLESQPGSALSVPKLLSREEYALAGSSGAESPRTGPATEAGAADSAGFARVDCRFSETVGDEFAQLSGWMAQARAEHLRRHGSPPSAAVVFRSRKHMPAVQAALHEAGIPCRIIGLGGLLTTPEITDLVCALRCLWYADAGSELIRLLAGPRFGVGVKDLDGLRRAARWFAGRDSEMQPIDTSDLPARDAELGRALPDPDRRVTLLDAIDEIAGMKRLDRPSLAAISEPGRKRLREAGQMLRRLRQGIGGSLLELLRAVEQELRIDIELDANERNGHRGAALARANLDAFADLVESFLATDEQGTLASVLEWLERAAETDDVAEHFPEPEPGTVQLITGHGAKGLEWDIVAVPRLVEGEFPNSSREGLGWLRPGQLPDELRGDIAARPRLDWRWLAAQANQKTLADALKRYRAELQDRHADEERRLAYVAMTRAASRLLLTGSWWAGTKEPRGPSVFLRELEEAGIIDPLPTASAHEDDPSPAAGRGLSWPLDPLGARTDAVTRAAKAVRAALEAGKRPAGQLDPTVELLLAEHDAAGATPISSMPPERITASTFHEFVESPLAAERNRLRPLPIRPYRRTRIGNLFHEWVERRATTALGTAVALPGFDFDTGVYPGIETDLDSDFEPDYDLASGLDSDSEARLQLRALIDHFERSRFADRQPIAVELEVNLPFAGRSLACKLDAVYRDDDTGRYEVVDWKSGRPPGNDAERASRFLQLDLYRHAYAQWAGIDPARIDVTLFYVAEGAELRGEERRSLEELEQAWLRARESFAAAEHL